MRNYFSKNNLFVLLIFILGLFLRLYRLPELMPFFGDVSRDYLTARDMTLKGIIPLVGCPSSVPWLHQGVFFIYILGIVLWLGRYNPLIGGYFVGTLGVLGVFGVFFLGKEMFSRKIGLWSALFYATSPLIIIFDRYPYHQSLISLFTIVYFIFTYYALKKNINYLILSSFCFGLLMQLELSNLILAPILAIIFWQKRKKIVFRILVFSIIFFLITWIPKIIFDFSNGFTQTFGFVAWTVHKIIPLRFPGDNPEVILPFKERILTVFVHISRIIFWPSVLVSAVIFLTSLSTLVKEYFKKDKRENKIGEKLILLGLIFVFLGLLVHGSPSAGYIPVIFPLVALVIGYFIETINNKTVKGVVLFSFFLLIIFNAVFIIKNNYFLLTKEDSGKKKNFYLSQSYKLITDIAVYLVSNSRQEKYNIIPLGEYAHFSSSKTDLEYLTWYYGNPPSEKEEKLKYFVYYNNYKGKIAGEDSRKVFPFMTVVKLKN